MSTFKLKDWVQITTFTKSYFMSVGMIKINNNEYARLGKDGFLYKYNINKDEWKKWIVGTKNKPLHQCTIAYDKIQKMLYIYSDTNKTLTKIDTSSNLTKTWSDLPDIGYGAHGIILNGQFNIIGGSKNNNHFVWDNQINKFIHIHRFADYKQFIWSSFIHLESKQSVLFFGGVKISKSPYLYNINQEKWSKLSCIIPKPLYHLGCTTSRNERFVILFGGIDANNRRQNDIYLLDIKTMLFTLSNIICADKGKTAAINMNNIEQEELICFGFIRKIFKQHTFKNLSFPYFYLIKIIVSYYNNEWIYLMNTSTGNHWKIALDRIITSNYN